MVAWLVAVSLVCCAVGFYFGLERERPLLGGFLGLLTGPLGVIVVLLTPYLSTCPQCLRDIPSGARRCGHCAQPVPRCPQCEKQTGHPPGPKCRHCGTAFGLPVG